MEKEKDKGKGGDDDDALLDLSLDMEKGGAVGEVQDQPQRGLGCQWVESGKNNM